MASIRAVNNAALRINTQSKMSKDFRSKLDKIVLLSSSEPGLIVQCNEMLGNE